MTNQNPNPHPPRPQPVSDAQKGNQGASGSEDKPIFTDYASL